MSIFQAIVLGIVQGLTEFLPISSSGHLIVIPWLFGWKEHSLTFDVMLHAGTLVAILLYFWSDWKSLIGGSLKDLRNGGLFRGHDSRMVGIIILGSIPAGILGVLLESTIEDKFRGAFLGIAAVMIGMGVLLWVADYLGRKARPAEKVGLKDAVGIGLAQAMALFPGVSRSGATITAGLCAGLTREGAARFSFLLATPIIFGAAAYNILKMAKMVMKGQPLQDPIGILAIGFIVSAIVGYAAIAGLLSYLKKKSMAPFVIYRIVFGLLIILVAVTR